VVPAVLKGPVHLKMKMLTLFSHPHVVTNLYDVLAGFAGWKLVMLRLLTLLYEME